MNEKQRHAFRWVMLEAIDTFNGKEFDTVDARANERAELMSLIDLAHTEDRFELLTELD